MRLSPLQSYCLCSDAYRQQLKDKLFLQIISDTSHMNLMIFYHQQTNARLTLEGNILSKVNLSELIGIKSFIVYNALKTHA